MRLTVRAYRRWIELQHYIKAEIANALDHLVFLINDIRNPGRHDDPGPKLPKASRTLKAVTSTNYEKRMKRNS